MNESFLVVPLLSISLLAGCAFESDDGVAERRDALIGDVPALLAVEGIVYAPESGFAVSLLVHEACYTAATKGHAAFGLETNLRIDNGIVVIGGCPLADLKAEAVFEPNDANVALIQSVPWDGDPLSGLVTVDYTVALGLAEHT